MEPKVSADVLLNKYQTSISITKNLINSWLGNENTSVSSDEKNDDPPLQARPPRLGLGASRKDQSENSWVTSKNEKLKSLPPALKKKIERQLQKKKEAEKIEGGKNHDNLKRKLNKVGDELNEQQSDTDDDDVDSKARITSRSKRANAQSSGFDIYKKLGKKKR